VLLLLLLLLLLRCPSSEADQALLCGQAVGGGDSVSYEREMISGS